VSDLFGSEAPPLRVQLDRSIDARTHCCGSNIAAIHVGRGPHAAELKCADCSTHRGWLPQEAHAFLIKTAERFGTPTEPIVLRDSSIGDHQMEKRKYDNSGILFKNEDKQKEKDRDYRGELTINGVEYWLSGWIKDGKRGKFLGLAIKQKDAPTKSDKPLAQELDDQIPF
jgi:hypothetical protein